MRTTRKNYLILFGQDVFHKTSNAKADFVPIFAETTWHIWVYTSDMRGGGTDANVHLVAYGRTKDGEYRKSDEIVLDNKVCDQKLFDQA